MRLRTEVIAVVKGVAAVMDDHREELTAIFQTRMDIYCKKPLTSTYQAVKLHKAKCQAALVLDRIRWHSSWAGWGSTLQCCCSCWNGAVCSLFPAGQWLLCHCHTCNPEPCGINGPTCACDCIFQWVWLDQHRALRLQQSKWYSALREKLFLEELWLLVHWLRLAGSLCCISELLQRPVTISLLCFRAIINHFNPKIESYAAVNHISQLSEDQVSQACERLFILLSGIQVLWSALCSLQLMMCSSMRAKGGFLVSYSDVDERRTNKALA